MPRLLDPSDPREADVARRLDSEPVLWLGTVSPRGRPHTVPVWFLWSDPTIIVFSRPDTAKVAHLRSTAAVSVSLDSAASGADIVLGEGDAVLATPDDVRDVLGAFEHKYAPMLGGQPLEHWLESFAQPIVITLTKLIAWSRTPDGLDYRSLTGR